MINIRRSEERRGKLRLVVSPGGHDGSLTIDQDARLYAGLLVLEQQTQHELRSEWAAWLHVARGRLKLNELELGVGDGAAIRGENVLTLQGLDDTEFVLWELPAD